MIDWLLSLSFFLHLLATVIWLGGLALLTLLIWPEARTLIAKQEQGGAVLDLLDRLRKRFYPLANLSLVVLIVTGLFQMEENPHYDGLLQLTNDWTRAILLKHVAVLGMLVVGMAMQWGVLPALERATLLARRGKDQVKSSQDMARLQRRERQLLIVNLVLGVVVLLFTAIARSI